jgi:hypothetical protein
MKNKNNDKLDFTGRKATDYLDRQDTIDFQMEEPFLPETTKFYRKMKITPAEYQKKSRK